jgi:hypothetical protein
MHLGSAVTLAHELDLHSVSHDVHNISHSEVHNPEAQARLLRRCERLKRLLFISINQLASRIGNTISKQPFQFAMRDTIHGPAISTEAGWHDFVTCWIDLTRLMRSSTELLFPAKIGKDVWFRNGHYVELLKHFRPLLQQWWDKYHPISGKT